VEYSQEGWEEDGRNGEGFVRYRSFLPFFVFSSSLTLPRQFFFDFWFAGALKIVSDGLTVTSPLVTRALITFATDAYYAHRGVPGFTSPSIGRGIGLAFGLWAMQIVAALCLHSFFRYSAGTGSSLFFLLLSTALL
jgi:hypothetical protein